MIVYLNNRKYIEEQREFGSIGNFFKNIGSVFSRKPTTTASPSVVTSRVKRGGNNIGLNSSSVTPVVPNTKPANTPKTTVPGTNVKVDANADIQAQSLQYLNSGQVKSAQANAGKITASANQGNKKFEKQQQLLNKADEANQVLNAGGNTYVMGAKSTGDIKTAINNANPVNQYQGQVTNKPTTPPPPPPTTQPTNNTQSNTGQNNNTTTNNNNNNNNSKTGNKPNWWNRWGKTTAKVTAGVGAVGTLGAGVYGLHELHKMTSSDDR